MYEYKFFEDTKDEIRQKGYFCCSNRELRDELYKVLKPSMPTLYRWEDKNFLYLNVIQREQVNNIVTMVEKREKLKEEIKEIEFVLKKLDIDLKELGID